jgi:hypothetical protein
MAQPLAHRLAVFELPRLALFHLVICQQRQLQLDNHPHEVMDKTDHGVFKTPAILDRICFHSSSDTHARLLYISGAFFAAASPYVWEQVEGARHVFAILASKIVLNEDASETTYEIVRSFSVPL